MPAETNVSEQNAHNSFVVDVNNVADFVDTDYGNCYNCNERFENEEDRYMGDDDYVCHNDNDDNFDIPSRDYDDKKYISRAKLKTEILQSNRGFGVEIECYANSEYSMDKIHNGIDQRIGISEDGSLGSKGFELQFPLINGINGERLVYDTCEKLKENAHVNDTCGYHVHLQCKGSEQSYPFIQRLMFMAVVFDDVIMSFLPKTRRDNRYCQSLKQYISLDRIVFSDSREELEHVWYRSTSNYDIRRRKQGKYDDSRYYGFNFHCYLSKTKHLEIRHHTGTINPIKILNWANLHLLFLDAVKQEVENEPNIQNWNLLDILTKLYDKNFSNKGVMEEKTSLFFDFIKLSDKGREYFINRQKEFNTN